MNAHTFAKPVYLRDGKHLVREIANVAEAIDFLQDWTETKRDVVHEAALRTCLMAHDGLKPVKVARDAIRAFGVKKGILEREITIQPWMINPVSGGHTSV